MQVCILNSAVPDNMFFLRNLYETRLLPSLLLFILIHSSIQPSTQQMKDHSRFKNILAILPKKTQHQKQVTYCSILFNLNEKS